MPKINPINISPVRTSVSKNNTDKSKASAGKAVDSDGSKIALSLGGLATIGAAVVGLGAVLKHKTPAISPKIPSVPAPRRVPNRTPNTPKTIAVVAETVDSTLQKIKDEASATLEEFRKFGKFEGGKAVLDGENYTGLIKVLHPDSKVATIKYQDGKLISSVIEGTDSLVKKNYGKGTISIYSYKKADGAIQNEFSERIFKKPDGSVYYVKSYPQTPVTTRPNGTRVQVLSRTVTKHIMPDGKMTNIEKSDTVISNPKFRPIIETYTAPDGTVTQDVTPCGRVRIAKTKDLTTGKVLSLETDSQYKMHEKMRRRATGMLSDNVVKHKEIFSGENGCRLTGVYRDGLLAKGVKSRYSKAHDVLQKQTTYYGALKTPMTGLEVIDKKGGRKLFVRYADSKPTEVVLSDIKTDSVIASLSDIENEKTFSDFLDSLHTQHNAAFARAPYTISDVVIPESKLLKK